MSVSSTRFACLDASLTRPYDCRFVVDSADMSSLESAKTELLSLLERPELAGIPTLILCNKSDLPDALKVEQMIERLWVSVLEETCVSDADCA